MGNNKVLDELAARPYRIADALGIHANTVQRWITFLTGRDNTSFKAHAPHKSLRPLLARVLGVSPEELDQAFSTPGRNGDE